MTPRLRRLSAVAATTVAIAAAPALAVAPTAAADSQPTGPDVASYQHPNGACIDWKKVATGTTGSNATPPRQFAFVKATEGSSYVNPWFGSCASDPSKGDWSATLSAGLARGAYHFARPALPISTAVTQADYFLKTVGPLNAKGDLPPVLDIEVNGGLVAGDLVTWAQTWLDEVWRKSGRVPIVYSYPYFLATAFGGSTALSPYPLWIADYGDSSPPLPTGWKTWTAWQYTSNTSQPGIGGGGVDMSRFNGDTTALAALADGTAPQTWNVTTPAAPISVTAKPADSSATVSWVPGNNGGALVSSWVVTASNGAHATVSGSSTSAKVKSLTNGDSYTFTVHAVNSAGTGAESAKSPAVVPFVPTSVSSSISAKVIYANAATMSAKLVRTDTNAALSGRSLAVYARPHGTSSWTHVTDAKTDSSGTARYRWRATRSMDMRMAWSAPRGWQSQTTSTRTTTVVPIPTDILSKVSASKVHYPSAATMTSTLVRTDTKANLPGRTVLVYHRNHGTTRWAKPVSVTTNSKGVASWRFVPHVSTDLMMRWNAPTGWTSQQSYIRTVTVIPIPTALTSSLSPSALSYGASTTLNATLSRTDTKAPLGGRTVAVYVKRHGTATWHAYKTLTTDAHGAASLAFRPSTNTDVMLAWAAPSGWAPATTPLRVVVVRPVVTVSSSAAHVAVGRPVTLTGTVSPAFPGATVLRQDYVGGRWRTEDSAVLTSSSAYSFTFTPSSAGTVRERVVLPATVTYGTGASPAVTITAQ